MSYIIGISALYHDSAAVLLKDGVVVAAAQEERFTRVKHDSSLPVRSVRWLCQHAGIRISDVDYFCFYEKPLKKFERILATSVATFPKSIGAFPTQMHSWLSDKLWIRTRIAQTFSIRPDKILFGEHHLSHAASAFFVSPFREATVLVVDGVGEWATTSVWKGQDNSLQPMGEIRYPHSVGLFYSAITAHLGFAVNEGEYKVMGMAAYGQPKHLELMQDMLRLHDDGSFSLNLDYFSFHYSIQSPTTSKLVNALGTPRAPGTPFDLSERANSDLRKLNQHYADIAASAQAHLEATMLHLAKSAIATCESDALCLAGGVSLNARANGVLSRSGLASKIWAQPAAGDAGAALGAALWVWHEVLGNPRNNRGFPVDFGREWKREETQELLKGLGLPYTDTDGGSPTQAANDLQHHKCIAWCQGRFEWGPRALGNRSILANPTDPKVANRINRTIKFREPFRPFAPMVSESHADEWFDIPDCAEHLVKYMMATVNVKESTRLQIPAVTHVDGSARVQVIDSRYYPPIRQISDEFRALTSCPVILNTSLNVKGDAMAASPIDAIHTFLKSKLDVLYLNDFRITQPKRTFGVPEEMANE